MWIGEYCNCNLNFDDFAFFFSGKHIGVIDSRVFTYEEGSNEKYR